MTPLVELGRPFLGAQIHLDTTEAGYTLRVRTPTAISIGGLVAPIRMRDGEPARGGIARVYHAGGRELVALLFAHTRQGSIELFFVRTQVPGG